MNPTYGISLVLLAQSLPSCYPIIAQNALGKTATVIRVGEVQAMGIGYSA